MSRVALVIGAGSIKCAAAIGLQKVLKREGINIDFVVGCSGGSLYAVGIALGWNVEEAERQTHQLWTREITRQRNTMALFQTLLPRLFRFDGRFGLINDHLILDRLRKAYGDRTFADAKIPLHIVATDYMNGDKVVLTQGKLVDAVRASIAIPFVFKPWPVDGRLMLDGAMVDPLPVDVAIKEGADVILALGFDSPYQTRIDSTVRYAFQVTTIMTNHLLRANFAFHNLAHHTEIIAVVPEFAERVGAFDTSKLSYIIEEGARAMEAQIPYLRRLLAQVPA